ncbi:YjbH domain-containing protein [Halomonas sp. TRM85114]|nr:YjbH domain-containing protein [Halomonas jincaotanensis]
MTAPRWSPPPTRRERANIAWRPLTRDGGARLGRRYTLLYGITHDATLAVTGRITTRAGSSRNR